MLRCPLVLMFIALLCAWLAPSKTLRDSALQALDSSVLCGLGGLDTEDEREGGATQIRCVWQTRERVGL